ncbi:MAG: hypothetical protein ABJA64_03130 [Candidatus Saccharibacteria bacterium]
MNKDVIYIDVEDDITAIIGKVKSSKEKVVALVPPKRVGLLQSAVNLRLLGRAAKQADKHLVLITNNAALIALSAAAQLPVAKNLQTKPEIAEISALEVDDGEDVIDGAQLPVGELVKTADEPVDSDADMVLDGIDMEGGTGQLKKAAPPAVGETPTRAKAKAGSKVPNFNKFRKKLVLIIGGSVLLLIFLIWAIFFSARATVVITAKTTSKPLSQTVTLSTTAATSSAVNTIHALRQEQKKTVSVDFDATGQKDAGSKATGTVQFSTNQINKLGSTIPAGTQLTSSSGSVYVTTQSVTFDINNYGGANAGVAAAENGTQYNGATGGMSGAPSGVSANLTGPTSGGVTKMVTVVTAADVQKAAEQLATQEDSTVKTKLQNAFGKGVKVIDTSYSLAKSDPVSVPAVGAEATAKAKLSTELTYSMFGVAQSELSDFLDDTLAKKIENEKDQRAYDNGAEKAAFTDFVTKDGATTVKITANGQVGPKINDDDIKGQVKGKRYGEVQSQLESINGVDAVDVKFWPFWVSSVPNDVKRISIEFKLNASE